MTPPASPQGPPLAPGGSCLSHTPPLPPGPRVRAPSIMPLPSCPPHRASALTMQVYTILAQLWVLLATANLVALYNMYSSAYALLYL